MSLLTSLNISRRAFLLLPAAVTLGVAAPLAKASEIADPFANLTVGEYIRLFAPEVFGSLGAELKSSLDSSRMYSQTPAPRAYLDQNVSISAWRAGAGSVGYSFSFTCSASCPSLYALVTVNNLSTGSTYSREFWGSGTSLRGSGTASGLSSGSCRAVVTAFAPEPPVGTTSYYSQDWSTVNV